MNYPSPHEIARCLQMDLGLESGIRYADRISRSRDPHFAVPYAEAARILRGRLASREI